MMTQINCSFSAACNSVLEC